MTTYSCVSTEFGGFLKDSPIVFQTVPECSTEFSGLFQTEVPYNEVLTERQVRKPQYLCGFRDFPNRINLPLYTKFTPIGAKNGAETKKSHNLRNEWAVP